LKNSPLVRGRDAPARTSIVQAIDLS